MRFPFFQKRSLENPKVNLSSTDVIEYLGGSNGTVSGENVNDETALTLTAVWAAVNRISNSVAQLPLQLMRKKGNERNPATKHPVYKLFNDRPNQDQTPFIFLQTCQSHALLTGNAYGYIVRNKIGNPLFVRQLMPDKIIKKKGGGNVFFEWSDDDGQKYQLDPNDVIHVPGLGYNGLTGFSNVQMHKEALGLGLAAQTFGAQFFGNGASMGGVLTHPSSLGGDAKRSLKASWDKLKGGGYKGVAVLEEGIKYERIGIPPDDAQFLQTRTFQVTEIARMFDIPPHMIADLAKSSFSNISEQSIEYLRYTLMPWLIRWEQELNIKLLTKNERANGYYFKFNVSALLRGTQKERYESYAIGINTGFLSRNEVRGWEDLNPVDGLDEFLTPLNMSEGKDNDEQEL